MYFVRFYLGFVGGGGGGGKRDSDVVFLFIKS